MTRTLSMLFLCLLVLTCTAWSQDNQPIDNAEQDTITISKSDFEDLKARIETLEQEVQQLKGNQPTAPAVDNTTASEESGNSSEQQGTPASGRQLLLPDISFIAQAKGLAGSDKHDDQLNRVQLTEAEIGIQGYVYPQVKADAFITMSPAEDESAQVEEAYLTYLGLRRGLNFYVGEKHVAFGRTNLLHSHSWPYVNQPFVIRNLVAEESLTGQGVAVSYLLPAPGNMFAQLDLGTWCDADAGEPTDPADMFTGPAVGPGAGFSDKFNTARLWTGTPFGGNAEVELGGSYAEGDSGEEALLNLGRTRLTGVDFTYRHFGEGTSRLLLRGENFWRREKIGDITNTATGYYLFGNYRWNKYGSIGLLYDWSEYPQATNLHESALSLILTKQFSEQYYLRLQAMQGSRPDENHFNEYWIQWVWGVGPHTHNLE